MVARMTGLPLHDAARVLGVRPGTLRRWVREGCPAQHGRRGRGHSTLVDPESVRQWREADPRAAAILEIAGALPDLLAIAIVESWRQSEGVDKRRLAGLMVATWYTATTAILDHARTLNPNVPDVSALPESMVRLRKTNRE